MLTTGGGGFTGGGYDGAGRRGKDIPPGGGWEDIPLGGSIPPGI